MGRTRRPFLPLSFAFLLAPAAALAGAPADAGEGWQLGKPGQVSASFGAGYAEPLGANAQGLRGSFGLSVDADYQASRWVAWGIQMQDETSFSGSAGNPSLGVVEAAPDVKFGKTVAWGSHAARPYAVLGAGLYSLEEVDYKTFSGGGTFPAGATVPVSEFGWSAGLGLDFAITPRLVLGVEGRFHDIVFSGSGFQMATPLARLTYYIGRQGGVRGRRGQARSKQ